MRLFQKRLISYAYAFISYLFRTLSTDEVDSIKAIYLFGSVSEGNARPTSDVDIFIDATREFKVNVEKFYSTREFQFFKRIGIDNPINVIVGKLDEWSLKESINRGGIILYGRKVQSGEVGYLIWWEPPKDNVNFHRKLFGYFGKNKRYPGLIEKINGMRIGKNAVLVKNAEKVIELMKEFNVKFEMRRVFL